jgi:HEAT repeat protein
MIKGNEIDKTTSRIKRGEISGDFVSRFSAQTDRDLILQLTSDKAQERTAAAVILGKRRSTQAIIPLCKQMEKEKALYARIGISEALGLIGQPAIPHLIALLGKIGTNQYRELPQQGFYKKNYPLPRDLAARTLIKIGLPALKELAKVSLSIEKKRLLEAIDAMGYITFYNKDWSAEAVLLELYRKHDEDPLIIWKLLRAFQALPSLEVQKILEAVVFENSDPALRWEAIRSLGQLGHKISIAVIEKAKQDPHVEVRKMARLFLCSFLLDIER